MIKFVVLTLFFGIASLFDARIARGQSQFIPPDSGVVNVRTAYGAKGDGVTDDSAAIQRAISENLGANPVNAGRVLYFPKGTYLVSKRLDWKDVNGVWSPYLTVLGESRSGTVIKLEDNAPGYTNVSTPKAVLFTSSLNASGLGLGRSSACGNIFNCDKGEGNEAFRNNIINLTVDLGSGNRGAIGIDFLGSNLAVVRDVTIYSPTGQCFAGLDISRKYTGPQLVSDVLVDGCNYGVRIGQPFASVTMENVTVRNQSVAGILNERQITSVRRLTSENSVPAVINRDGAAHLVLIDSTLSGGSGGNAAIRNEDGARMFLRNIKTSGYGAALDDGGSRVPGPDIGEWVSDPAFSQFASPKRSLSLPIRETPKYANTNPNDWANVVAYGAKKCTQGAKTCTADSTVGIQAAMNSSKPVVYFPNGFYRMSRTVTIPDSVRMVVGFEAKISPSKAGVGPAFVVKNKAGQTTTLERLVLHPDWWNRSGRVFFTNPQIRHEGAGDLVVRDASMGGLATEDGSGPLFVDNYRSGPLEVGRNTKVWVRQLNTEQEGLQVKNTGGTLWVLGHKTERVSAPSVEAYGGATEILGAWYYHPHHKIRPAGVPVIRIKDGQFSGIWSTGNLGDWTDHVVETQNGVNKTLTRDAISTNRGTGRAMPLYTSEANDR